MKPSGLPGHGWQSALKPRGNCPLRRLAEAKRHDNEAGFARGEEMLSQPTWYAHLVRWAVEVRQKQLAESRARVIPESLKNRDDEGGQEENIQFKRTFRQ